MMKFSKSLRHFMLVSAALGFGLSGYATAAVADEALKVGKAVPHAFRFVPLDVGVR
jgi:hypothetical protein